MSQKDAETAPLLAKFESLPDLLALARREEEQSGGDRYAIQERLAKEHRAQQKPFVLATPMRHMEHCASGEHRFGAVRYELIVPQGRGLFGARELSVKFSEVDLHEVREHGTSFAPEISDVLRSLP
ncbi:hypothetical protein [Hyalangium versicolor]|uniref:hypothetical protein n=1 Tax=Hyalangium versicolor TaxID=2861190 RepID=UPI001CCF5807|nr:hypothetical protein [Hyalangium versicolor]